MPPPSRFISWLGALVFLAGVLTGLSLSAAYLWGEIEARVYSSLSGVRRMRLECPLMISPDETGTVSAEIFNRTAGEIKPVVIAEISHVGAARRTNETFVLEPGETQVVRWDVNSSDVIFESLILVNIIQSQYGENPSHSGSCSILVFNLFGLTGQQTFGLMVAGTITSLLVGGGLWSYSHSPLEGMYLGVAQAHAVLGVLTITALLSSIPRWWGLTAFLDTVILIMLGVIPVEFILFPRRDK